MADKLLKKISSRALKTLTVGEPKKTLTASLGQKLYDALGLKLGKEGIVFGEQGFFYSPISKKWEVSGWYGKKEKGKGFAGKDYDFGFSLGRKF